MDANRLDKGDKLDIITPTKNIPFILDKFTDIAGGTIESASAGQGFKVCFKVPEEVEVGYILRKHL